MTLYGNLHFIHYLYLSMYQRILPAPVKKIYCWFGQFILHRNKTLPYWKVQVGNSSGDVRQGKTGHLVEPGTQVQLDSWRCRDEKVCALLSPDRSMQFSGSPGTCRLEPTQGRCLTLHYYSGFSKGYGNFIVVYFQFLFCIRKHKNVLSSRT